MNKWLIILNKTYKTAVPYGSGLQTTVDKERLLTPVLIERSNLANKTNLRTGILHGTSSQLQQSHSENESMKKTNEKIWSPWRGICQVNTSMILNKILSFKHYSGLY